MTDKKAIPAVLRSVPLAQQIDLPNRADILPKIERGEVEYLDFPATVFRDGQNRNFVRFRPEDMPIFAASFVGQPFLRNHDQWDIDSRDGTILESNWREGEMQQVVRLTTRRGMTDFIEGKIDRFSIGWWDYSAILCSICNTDYWACAHLPGRQYNGVTAEVVFVEPKGKETSAVNAPAVPGTRVRASASAEMAEKVGFLVQLGVLDDDIPAALEEDNAPPNDETGQEPVSVETAPSEEPDAGQAQVRLLDADRRRLAIATQEVTSEGDSMKNIREMLAARAAKLEQAKALHAAAEAEARDLTEEERDQFSALMDAVEAEGIQIKALQAERERLALADELLAEMAAPGGEAERPDANGPATITRAEYDAMDRKVRARFIQAGGNVTD